MARDSVAARDDAGFGHPGEGTESGATSVNERGQIVGASFTNSVVNPTTGFPTLAPFLWENGRMRNLGTLGLNGTVIPGKFFKKMLVR